MKYPTAKFWERSRAVLAVLLAVFMLIGAISCTCKTSDNQGVAWQLDYFALRYDCTPPTEASSDISPIVKPGQDVYIYAEIKNVGTDEGAYEWQVYLDNADNPFYHETTSNLVAGDSELIGHPVGLACITISSDVIGQHEVKIGTVTRHFTVQTPAEISEVTVVPSCIAWLNSDLTITGKIRNPGSNDAHYTIHLEVDNREVDKKEQFYVPRYSTVEFTFSIHNEYNYNIGCHSFLITVDGSESKGTGVFEVGTGDHPCTGTCGTTATSSTPLEPTTPPVTSYPPLTLEVTNVSECLVGEPYSADVRPGGGKPPYGCDITSGSLPDGIIVTVVDDYFRIEGIPNREGVYNFDITVDDSSDSTSPVQANLKITVLPNLKGTWTYTITVTNAEGVCEGEGGIPRSRPIRITQNGRQVTFSGFLGNPDNKLTGEIKYTTSSSGVIEWTVEVSGSYWEDYGTTTTTHRLVIHNSASMSGEESWTWTGGGGTCPNGKGSITATRISGP